MKFASMRGRTGRKRRDRAWRNAVRLALGAALAGAVLVGPGQALEVDRGGDFTFDIRNHTDMRKVGELSGITIKRDIPARVGLIECARWARRFGVRPYEAVVSGTLPNRRLRVWICAGNADNRLLSETYCKQMGMRYVRHDGPVVTCRFREET